jgi:uncharacterized protein YbjT (DUF2867 family)
MLLVMGATGRMGGAVLRHVAGPTRAASRSGRTVAGAAENVAFDLDDPGTHDRAVAGCRAAFLMRPPPSTGRASFDRLLAAARRAGVGHVICASVWGAEESHVLPHRHIEAAVHESGIAHTILRPADFMQNLADIHGQAIRERGEIAVPAGRGRSAFLDVDDVGRAVAAILRDPARHAGRSYALTGPEALTFGDVARTLTEVLGREVRYRPRSVPGFVLGEVRHGRSLGLAVVMAALYTVQRLGRAAPVRPDFTDLTGAPPGDLRTYLARERDAFVGDRARWE